MNRIMTLISLIAAALVFSGSADAAEIERLRAMSEGGPRAQAEAFANVRPSGKAVVQAAAGEDRPAAFKAFQPGAPKNPPRATLVKNAVSGGASRTGGPDAAGGVLAGVVLGGAVLDLGSWIAAVVMGTMVGAPLVVFMVGAALMVGGFIAVFIHDRGVIAQE